MRGVRRSRDIVRARASTGYLNYADAIGKEFAKTRVPALLFPMRETLLPGSALALHLYEARFLGVLEKAMSDTGGLIAHVTYAPRENGETSDGLRVNATATLARVRTVRKDDASLGARIEVIGESRVKLEDVESREPYIVGVFTHVPQMGDKGTYQPSDDELAQVKEVTDYIEAAVKDVLLLSDKLKVGKGASDGGSGDDDDEDGMWTHKEVGDLRSAIEWVDAPAVTIEHIEKKVSMADSNWTARPEGFAHSALTRAERLSFAVLQIAPASTETDLHRLIACRAVAMSTEHGLMDRLRLGVSVLDDQLQTLRAKVALKSLSL